MPRLTKRGDVWYTWVPRPDGGTRRVTTNCTDKRAAEKRAAELEREAVDPAHAAANQATTAEACGEFLESRKRRGRAEGTLHHYGVKLGHLVRLLPPRLADVDARECEAFIGRRIAEGAAQTTVKKEIRALGATLRHAARTGLYARDILAVIPELEDTYKPRTRALDPWELVTLANALEPERAAHVVFITMTASRWSESLRARAEDVAPDCSLVRIRGTKTAAAAATVPVPPVLRHGLAWALARAPGKRPLFYAWGNVRRDLEVACRRAGIEPCTPNDLRRSVASWLRAWGVPTDQIAAFLRHTTNRMVERVYGRLSTPELATLLEKQTPAGIGGLLMDGKPVGTPHPQLPPATPKREETS